MWLWLILAALPVDAAVLDAPAGDPCPWAALIPASLDRLPTLTLTATAAVRVEVRVSPGGLHLRLTDGAHRLAERDLPNDGACEARADGVAFVVEQQLRGLGYVPPLPEVPPPGAPLLAPPPPAVTATRAAPPPPRAPPAPAVAEGPAAATATASATPALGALQLWLGAAGVAEAPGPAGVRGGGQVTVALRAARPGAVLGPSTLGLGLQVGAVAPGAVSVVRAGAVRGTLSVWSLLVTAGAEVCWAAPGGAACGVLQAGVERVQGAASGDQVFRAAGAALIRPAVGAGARYRFLGLGRVALELGAEALWRPSPAAFSVEDGAVWEDAPAAARLSLGAALPAW